MIKILTIIIFLFISTNANADYLVTGKVTGGVKGMLGFSLKIVNVDAVMEDGKLYTIGKRYRQVSEYDKRKGRCWLRVDGLSGIMHKAQGRSWHELQSDGTYKKLKNLEYITFPCIKE